MFSNFILSISLMNRALCQTVIWTLILGHRTSRRYVPNVPALEVVVVVAPPLSPRESCKLIKTIAARESRVMAVVYFFCIFIS